VAEEFPLESNASYMARALVLARRGETGARPNPVVGCVMVNEDRVVGEGFHERAGDAHAEIQALKSAGRLARGACCYVTLEPCCHHGRTPPCTQALIDAGVSRIFIAMLDPNPQVSGRGVEQLNAHGLLTEVGLLEAAAAALNVGFIKRMQRGWPQVRVKLALSLDGRTATRSGESRWISSEQARQDVHRLRACSGAILTGIGTVAADDPRLTARSTELPAEFEQPMRVVLDSNLRFAENAAMLQEPGRTLLVTTVDDPRRAAHLREVGAEVLVLRAHDGRVPLKSLFQELARLEINDVLVEAGPRLSGALIEQDLVDEIIFYVAPRLIGHEGRASFELGPVTNLSAAKSVEVQEVRAVGPDLRITVRPAGEGASSQ